MLNYHMFTFDQGYVKWLNSENIKTCILPIAPMATSGGIITALAYVPPSWEKKKLIK